MTALLVAVGAAVGAPLRYLTDRALRARYGDGFPWGTLAVNITGCLVLGVVTGAAASPAVTALVGDGFCGALTTYSAFSHDTMRLTQGPHPGRAAVNVIGSVAAGLAAASVGLLLGTSAR